MTNLTQIEKIELKLLIEKFTRETQRSISSSNFTVDNSESRRRIEVLTSVLKKLEV